MELIHTALPGCLELRPRVLNDARGIFVKTFQREAFRAVGLASCWSEQYYSTSRAGVLRGLHFQVPPFEHAKLVYCIAGEVFDVAVDLRMGSPTYGKHISLHLSAEQGNMIYLPAGIAHGFYTIREATLVYNVTSSYSAEHDMGIRWDSAHVSWPSRDPILSQRDMSFPTLADFVAPFRFVPTGNEP